MSGMSDCAEYVDGRRLKLLLVLVLPPVLLVTPLRIRTTSSPDRATWLTLALKSVIAPTKSWATFDHTGVLHAFDLGVHSLSRDFLENLSPTGG